MHDQTKKELRAEILRLRKQLRQNEDLLREVAAKVAQMRGAMAFAEGLSDEAYRLPTKAPRGEMTPDQYRRKAGKLLSRDKTHRSQSYWRSAKSSEQVGLPKPAPSATPRRGETDKTVGPGNLQSGESGSP